MSPQPRLPEVLVVRSTVRRDDRGWFMETWRAQEFARLGVAGPFLQDSQVHNGPAGVLRGLHAQRPPMEQGTLVRCLSGRAFDVAVDVRPGSPRFGRWDAVELSASDGVSVWIPPGFAHGYVTLEPDTDLSYKMTGTYSPGHELCVRWDDPAVGIDWPVQPSVLSPRDAAAGTLSDAAAKITEAETEPNS